MEKTKMKNKIMVIFVKKYMKNINIKYQYKL